jgi:hypothetical protein
MSFTNTATVAKDAFIVKVREQLNLNMNSQGLSYEGLKIRLKTANRVAKIINKDMRNIIDEMICASSPEKTAKLMSVMYLKMCEMINGCSNVHRNSYLTSEKEIIKIKKYAIKLQKNSRKALDILIEMIQKVDKSIVPSYNLIVAKHNNIQSEYWLRTRKPVNYVEEDANCDDPSDEDYKPYEHISKTVIKNTASRPKRNIPVVDYTGMDTDTIDCDSDYEFEEDDDEDDELDYCADEDSNDDDSEYNPSDDEEFEDDHVLEFCDDDYAEETEEDDDDYEDEDESNQEDNEFLSDYYNDPDYTSNKNVVDVDYDDDSEYIPDENDELDDDHVLEFDDDDYAEESEEDDDDYEDDSEDEEDKQFVNDYNNDPDYNPNDEEDEEDELEYDYSFLNKKVDENENIVLKAGIVDDNDEEDPDYDPTEDEEDEEDEDEEEYFKYISNENILNICKRRFENGNVVFRWVKMTKEEAEKKYDEDYVLEEN